MVCSLKSSTSPSVTLPICRSRPFPPQASGRPGAANGRRGALRGEAYVGDVLVLAPLGSEVDDDVLPRLPVLSQRPRAGGAETGRVVFVCGTPAPTSTPTWTGRGRTRPPRPGPCSGWPAEPPLPVAHHHVTLPTGRVTSSFPAAKEQHPCCMRPLHGSASLPHEQHACADRPIQMLRCTLDTTVLPLATTGVRTAVAEHGARISSQACSYRPPPSRLNESPPTKQSLRFPCSALPGSQELTDGAAGTPPGDKHSSSTDAVAPSSLGRPAELPGGAHKTHNGARTSRPPATPG